MRVALFQPEALRDAVGLVLKLFRLHLIEVGKDRFFQDFGMQFRHAVHSMASHDAELCHADVFVGTFFDHGHRSHLVQIARIAPCDFAQQQVVDLIDQHQVARQQLFKDADRPSFLRFGQDGVIGVGKGAARDLPRFLKAEIFLVDQDAHHFRNGDGGMRVIKLDGGFVGKVGVIVIVQFPVRKDVLQGG